MLLYSKMSRELLLKHFVAAFKLETVYEQKAGFA